MLVDHPINPLTQRVIGAAIEVHRHLGPGLLESAYQACLCCELDSRGLRFQQDLLVSLNYKGQTIPKAYRMDLLVEERLAVELKVVQTLEQVHEAQLLTYMRLRHLDAGLLINFNVAVLRDGIRRLLR